MAREPATAATRETDRVQAACDEMQRELTPRGEKQAARMAAWLNRGLPKGARIWVSPARRAEQTAQALGRKYKLRPELAPGASASQLLQMVQWPDANTKVLVVGHQPMLGQAVAQLIGLQTMDCTIKKGALWWLRKRQREASAPAMVVTVQSPAVLLPTFGSKSPSPQ